MNLVNNNISPLPFYYDIEQQNHRKDYAFSAMYPLVTYKNFLIPFQVVLDSSITSAISFVRLYDYNTGKYIDITDSIKQNGLKIKSYDGFKILSYPALFPINEIKQEGLYYLAIYFQRHGTLFSDIFSISNSMDDFAILEYSNSYNFEMKNGAVDFSDNFKFKCYLKTQVGKPEYSFEEEATERLGYSFIESQISKKIYKFTFIAPEYLCDALRIVRLCEDKTIKSKGLKYDMITFNMDVNWEEQGDLAAVECEFETDTVIANLGGRYRTPLGGEYNKDYNNDYNKE